MSRKNNSSKNNKSTDKTSIYVAIIGLIGTVTVALVSFLNTRTQVLLPVLLTETAISKLSSTVPPNFTDTSQPAYTLAPTKTDQIFATQTLIETSPTYTSTPTTVFLLIATPKTLDDCKVYYDNNDYERAVACYQTFIQPESTSTIDEKIETYFQIGISYKVLGNYPAAIENLLAGLKIVEPNSPNQVNLYLHLGWAYKANGQKVEACDVFYQTLKLAISTNYVWAQQNSQNEINNYCK